MGRLRVPVPQRDVERAQRSHDGTTSPMEKSFVVHLLPQTLNPGGVLAEQSWRQQIQCSVSDEVARRVPGVAEADARQSVLRMDADETVVALGHGPGGKARQVVERHDCGGRFNSNNLRQGVLPIGFERSDRQQRSLRCVTRRDAGCDIRLRHLVEEQLPRASRWR